MKAKQRANPPSLGSSKNNPPIPRGSLRCFKKKYSSQGVFAAWIDLWPERLAGRLRRAMPMDTVLFKTIVRGEIEPTAKPPDRFGIVLGCIEETDIGVRRRNVGITRMGHQGDAHGFKAAPSQLWTLRGR